MKKLVSTLLVCAISGLLGAWLYATVVASTPIASLALKETAFDRVMRTGTIRCGYIPFAPYFAIDPQTGAKSGVGYEFMTAISEELGVKVDWVEEVGWGNFAEGLNTNRYDALCTPLWESGNRARAALLIRPAYTEGLFAYVREDDNRFDAGLDALNKADVRIADYDSDVTQNVRATQFPLAQELAVPALTSEGEYLLNVITRKADAVLVGFDAAERYNKNATVKLKKVSDVPVRRFSDVMAIRHGESDLKAALDSTISALIKSGKAAEILKKYPGQSLEE